jgi:hypothetical protein
MVLSSYPWQGGWMRKILLAAYVSTAGLLTATVFILILTTKKTGRGLEETTLTHDDEGVLRQNVLSDFEEDKLESLSIFPPFF